MNITRDLYRIVEHAHSLELILQGAARVIADRFRVDTCEVFLLDRHGELVRRTSGEPALVAGTPGAELEAKSMAARVTAERRVATHRSGASSLLAAPMLLRDRIVGAVVLRSTAPRDFSPEDIATLATIAAQLVGIVENARIIDAIDRGERPVQAAAPKTPSLEPPAGERVFRGVAASPGVAIGVAVFRGAYRLDLSGRELQAGDATVERARVRTAFRKTHNDISSVQALAAREVDEEHALIFASHLLLLSDPMLLEHIDREIERGLSAARAIDVALDEFEAKLRLVPDAYIRERIDDVDDLRTRLLDHVLETVSRGKLGAGVVLTSRIPPSLVIELKTEGAQALVTESGGATSHGVLLARAMAIPAVTGIADILPSVRPGDRLIVDGTAGVVVVRPTEETLAHYEKEHKRAEQARTEHARLRDVPARTADGIRVALYANVGVASDLIVARRNGADGVGLYRTEFPFIVRDSFPTRAEQVKIYHKAYEAFPDGPILFRILDLGGDKFLTGGHVATARSAFHGYRSIRVLFDHPDVLRDQVQAFALASAGRKLRILIPMVSSMEELRRVREMIDGALSGMDEPAAVAALEVGAMIEVPAAVELAVDLAREADFLSIGTNDLMQYALVVDREDSRMASMADPYHPAILRMIVRVVNAAHAAGKPVSVCGEIAARPDVALALLAVGIDSLSVVPAAIPGLKHALARSRLEPIRRAIGGVLALSESRQVLAALRELQSA